VQVCPERVDLIHPNFRKLCRLCADTDEWGQIQLITMLTRYGRYWMTCDWNSLKFVMKFHILSRKYMSWTRARLSGATKFKCTRPIITLLNEMGDRQSNCRDELCVRTELRICAVSRQYFLDPNKDTVRDGETGEEKKKKKKKKSGFYSDSSNSDSSSSDESDDAPVEEGGELDPDHRMLLNCAQPLLRRCAGLGSCCSRCGSERFLSVGMRGDVLGVLVLLV
jgi:hypothetical protein